MSESVSNILPDMNQKWILGGATIIVSVMTFLGGMVASSHQAQIDKNQERIWQIQSTAVTDDKLNQQIRQVQDYIDIRVQALETSQREIARQLNVLVNDQKQYQESMRETFESIRRNLDNKNNN